MAKKRSRFGFNIDLGPFHFSIGKRSWAELNTFFDRILKSSARKETVASQLESYRSWVQIAVNVIFRRTSEISYGIFRNDTDEKLKKNSHIYRVVNKIFVDPNPFMEFRFLKQYIQMSLDITGAGFLYLENDPFGLPARIWPIPIETFQKVELGDTFRQWIKGFTFTSSTGLSVTYRPDQILYFHYPDPNDPRLPCSPIKSQAYAVDIDHYISVYERDFFKNSARPDTTIQYPENVTIEQEDAKRLIEEWKQKFRGEGKYHEVAILDRGATLAAVNAKNEDLALMTLAQWSEDKILAAYGVPKGKVGLMKDVNKASAIANDTTFNSECVKPRLDLLDEVLTRGILQKYDERLEIRHDNPIPRDQEMDIKEHEAKVGVPTRTVNEQREMDGDKGIGPAGDVILVPLNFIALGQSPPVEPEEPEEPEGEEPEGGEEEEEKHVIQPREYSKEWLDAKWEAFRAYTEGWEGVWKSQLHVAFENQREEVLENLEAYWDENKSIFECEEKILNNFRLKWLAFLETYKDRTTEEIVQYFENYPEGVRKVIIIEDDGLRKIFLEGLIKKKQEGEMIKELEDYIHVKQDEAIDYILFDYDENRKVFDKMGRQISGHILVEQANEELIALGLEATFSLENPTARAWLGSKVKEFSDEVLSTKANQLRRTLAEGFKKGEGIRKLSDRVEQVYQGVINGRYDALRIARTETIAASNKGSFFGYDASGVVKEKEWLSTRDQRTRGAEAGDKADHYHMDGQRVKLKDPFIDSVSGARMMQPGDTSLGAGGIDTIMCRCTMVPHVDEKED